MSEFFVDVVFGHTKQAVLRLAELPDPSTSAALYTYKHTEKLEPGTLVVVDAANSGYALALVVRSGAREDTVGAAVFQAAAERLGRRVAPLSESLKWIVAAVDDSAYQKRKEDAKRAAALKATLEKRAAQLAELKKYEILAGDPESLAMIEELRGLSDLPAGLKALATKAES